MTSASSIALRLRHFFLGVSLVAALLLAGGCSAPTLAAKISADPSLSRFNQMIKQAGTDTVLSSEGPLTVFAPTDEALSRQPDLSGEGLRSLVLCHVVSERLTPADLAARSTIRTAAGHIWSVTSGTDRITIERATIVGPPQECSNGILYHIDGVLAP